MNRADSWDSLLQYHAARYGLDWRLLKAQMLAESAGNPEAVSPVGAKGLAQFMPKTWWEWWDERAGIQGPPPADRRNDPDRALAAQAAYMAWLFRVIRPRVAAPSVELPAVLAAYNWGVGRVLRLLAQDAGELSAIKLPAETFAYIARIQRSYAAAKGGG